jgi:hypothetical protein
LAQSLLHLFKLLLGDSHSGNFANDRADKAISELVNQ